MNTHIIGDTVRLNVSFNSIIKTIEDQNAAVVTGDIYNSNMDILLAMNVLQKQGSIGEYYIDFVPNEEGVYRYEFRCLAGETLLVKRARFLALFVN